MLTGVRNDLEQAIVCCSCHQASSTICSIPHPGTSARALVKEILRRVVKDFVRLAPVGSQTYFSCCWQFLDTVVASVELVVGCAADYDFVGVGPVEQLLRSIVVSEATVSSASSVVAANQTRVYSLITLSKLSSFKKVCSTTCMSLSCLAIVFKQRSCSRKCSFSSRCRRRLSFAFCAFEEIRILSLNHKESASKRCLFLRMLSVKNIIFLAVAFEHVCFITRVNESLLY